jgi:hypothetical protein
LPLVLPYFDPFSLLFLLPVTAPTKREERVCE